MVQVWPALGNPVSGGLSIAAPTQPGFQTREGRPVARPVAVAGLTRPQVTPTLWAQGRSAALVGDGSAAPARGRPGSGPVQAWA